MAKILLAEDDPQLRRVVADYLMSAESDQLLGFDLGAQDYLTKPFSPRILVARVKALLARGKPDSAILELGPYRWDQAAHKAYLHDGELSLNPKEFDLLTFFMRHAGQALNREQILQGVWKNLSIDDTRTVDTHVKRLRQKLGEHRADVQTVRNYGYRFEAGS